MEVIYTGLHQTPEMIVEAALQEDVDVVALSILSGAHMTLFPRVLELLRARERTDVLLTGGGIIPKDDMARSQRWASGGCSGRARRRKRSCATSKTEIAPRGGAQEAAMNKVVARPNR